MGLTVKEALRTDAFYYVTAATALGSFTYSALLPQISTHLLDQGTNSLTVVMLIFLLAGFGMAGKGVFGYLAERFTARIAMMLSLGGQTALISVIVAYPVGLHLWVIVPIFGFFFGAYGVLVTLLLQENFGLKYFGSIAGLSGLVGMVPWSRGRSWPEYRSTTWTATASLHGRCRPVRHGHPATHEGQVPNAASVRNVTGVKYQTKGVRT